MDDGPDPTQTTRRAWRTTLRKASIGSLPVEAVAEAMSAALSGDWRRDVRPAFIRRIGGILGPAGQGTLLVAVDVGLLAGFTRSSLELLLVDAAVDAASRGARREDGLTRSVEQALRQHAVRVLRRMEAQRPAEDAAFPAEPTFERLRAASLEVDFGRIAPAAERVRRAFGRRPEAECAPRP